MSQYFPLNPAGDLEGNMPKATVVKLRSIPISTTIPGTNELFAYNGSQWAPTDTPQVQNITILNAPSTATDGTNKQYVDGLIAGVSWKTLCTAASTATLTATYNNGTGGVGATLTNTGAQVALVLDGITLATQDRVLIKNQSSQLQNGIYVVTDTGSPTTDWILTRASDADGSPSGELNYATTFIDLGTTQSGSGWTQTTLNPTVGTSPIVWVQFIGPIVTTWSGGSTGLTPPTPTSGPITLGGTLNIASGGTNASATPTAGAIAYGTGTQYGFTAAGTTGQVLTSAGTGTPTWTDPNAETSTITTLATGTVMPLFVTGTGDVPLYINSSEYQLNAATGALQLGSAGIAIGEVGAAASTSVAGSIAIGASSVNDGGNCISIGPNTISAGVVNYQVIGFTNNITSGNGGIVLGNNCINDGSNSISIGQGASATSGNTIAIGQGATSTFNNLAIGLGATSNGATTIAIGLGANCSQSNATAIGPSANCSSNFGVALGDGSVSSGNFNSIAIGNADATNNGSIAIGVGAISSGSSGVAIGPSSIANSSDGIAIGNGASTNSIANAIALGTSAIPSSASFALAISTNTSSVTPAVLGTTLNGDTFQIEKYSQLYQTTATAAGTTTLTVTSAQKQYFTGTQTQTVVMPVTSTLALGFEFKIYNNSTGDLTIQSSGLNTITTIIGGSYAYLTCILTSGTTAASWSATASDQPITTLTSGTLFPTFVAGTGLQPVRINSAQFAINAATGALQLGSTGIAIGRVGGTASATFLESISLGSGANSTGTSSLSLGRNATANIDALAVGFGAAASAGSTIAIGPGATVSGGISIAIGSSATSTTTSAISIGRSSSTTQPDSIAIGYLATSSGSNAIAIGSPATANSSTGIAIGNGASTNSIANAVSLGTSASPSSSSFALAISTNSASVTPAVLGTTLNGNTFQIEKYSQLYQTTATAAGTTTLTVTSAQKQYFTGTQTQTVVMPVTSTLALGFEFKIYNNSTGVLTVQSSGLNTITTIPAGGYAFLTCILTSGTTAASWSFTSSDQPITTLTSGTLFPTFVAGTGLQPMRINSAQFAINAATGALEIGSSGIAIGRVGATAVASGTNSISIGQNITANTGTSTIMIGNGATLPGGANTSIVLGPSASVTGNGQFAISIGSSATAGSTGAGGSIAIGPNSTATPGSIVIGASIPAGSANNTIIIGNSAFAVDNGSQIIAIGGGANAASTTSNGSIAIGTGASTTYGSTALGNGAICPAQGAFAGGAGATCTGSSSVALGASATCASSSGVALGAGALTGTGTSNIILGASAGSATKSGANNIVIGTSAANIGTSSWTAQIFPQTSGSWLGDTRITFDGRIDPQGVFIGSTTGSSTTLTISTAVTNLIVLGMPIYGTGIGSGVFISAFGTGTGGAGTYTTSAAVNIPTINTTSVTSLAIGTGSKSLTVGTGLAYTAGQYVLIQNTIANYMHGVITSYVSGTGALVVSVSQTLGSGTFASWTVDLDILTDTILTVTVAPTAPATIFELSPITGTGVAANSQIIKFISGVANTVGATYTVDNSQTVASTTITASYSNVLNVTTATTGSLVVGMLITQSGGSAYDLLYITALGTGTGGVGTYVLNIPIISNAGTAIVTAPMMQLNSAVTGNLAFGVTGTGFAGTIVKLISGTQGAINSTYQMSNNQTVAANTAMTITNASATNIAIGPSSMQRTLGSNNIVLGNSAAQFLETGATNTIIGTSANLDRAMSNTVIIGSSAGGQYSRNSTSVILGNEACNGSCTFNGNITLAFTGNGDTGGISSTTLTITTVTTNRLVLGMRISGTGITAGTFINALGTGTGGLGTYTLSAAATITPGTAITGVTTLTLTSTPSGTFKLGMTIVGSNTGFGTTYVQELIRGSLGANGSTYLITTPIVNQNGGTSSFIAYSQAANAVAIGYQSLARSNSVSIGQGSSTLSDNSIAIGYQSINNGSINCISIGVNTISPAVANGTIIGYSNICTGGNGNMIIGGANTAGSINSIMIGLSNSTVAGGSSSIMIGFSGVSGTNSITIGSGSSTTSGGNFAIALGQSTTSTGTSTVAIGPSCSATSGSSIVTIGNTCISTVSTTVAIGVSNTTQGANSVAIGSTLNTGTGTNNIILGNTSGSATAAGADNIVIGRTAKQLGTTSWTAQIFPQLTGTWQANTLLTFSGNINPAGIFIGSTAGSSTTLTVTSAVQNAIFVGMPIYYLAGSISGVFISAFGTGTGGAGTYTLNTAINLAAISTSSTTSLTIGTGSQTLTVGTGLAFAIGQYAVIVNSPTDYMQGVVQSYVSGTGVLVVIVDKIAGSGTFASWTVDRSFITETIMTVTTAPTSPGVIYELSPITGAGVTAGSQLTRLTSGVANTIGATYAVDTSQTVATTTITATQSTLLTVTTATTGTLNAGTAITSVGGVAQSGLIITALGTGTGGTGTYVLSAPIIAPALSAIQIAPTMVLNSAVTGSLTFGSSGTGFSGTITRLTLGTSDALNSVYQMSTNQTVAASTAMTITNPAAGTVGVGLSALQRIVASNNIGLGNSVGTSLESGSGNILIGASSNAERTTINSVIIGTSAGGANVKSGGAVIEGASACSSSGTVSGAIWLGFVGTGYTLGTGTTLIIDSVTSNALVAGMPISGTGIPRGTYITTTSSNGSGGIGAYVLSASATIPFGTTITGTDIFRTTSGVSGTTLVRGAYLSGSTITASSMYIRDIVVQFSGSSIAYTFTATGPVTNMPVSTITYGVEPTNAVSIGQSSSASANSISIGSAALSLPGATTIGTSLTNIVPNTTQIGNNSLETFRILDPATGGFTNRNVKTTSASASITLTPVIALGGYLDATAVGAITITLDTGVNFDSNAQLLGNLYVGLSFQTTIVSSNATGQITYATATGITLKGTLTNKANTAQMLTFYRTAADSWDVTITNDSTTTQITSLATGTVYPTFVTATGAVPLNINTAQLVMNAADGALQLGSAAITIGQVGSAASTTAADTVTIGKSATSQFANSVVIGNAIADTAQAGLFMYHRSGVTASANMAGWISGVNELVELTSSRRYKDNIRDLEQVSQKVDNLRPVRFIPKPGYGKTPTDMSENIGFIAEEVEELFPEVVTKDDQGLTSGMMYDRLIPVLVREIQHLRTRVRALELSQQLSRTLGRGL